MEATAITSINPFPNNMRTAFQAYIQDPHHVNRERIPYSKWQKMHLFIDDPTLKPENPSEHLFQKVSHTYIKPIQPLL